MNNDNTVILIVSGGFADQLRYYRIGKSLESFYDKKVLYDISWYEKCGMDNIKLNKRNFELLNIFNDLDFNVYDVNVIEENISYYNFFNFVNKSIDKSQFLNVINNTKCIEGILIFEEKNTNIISEYGEKLKLSDVLKLLNYNEILNLDKYFINILNDDNKILCDDIINTENSIALHIRRTDYIYSRLYTDIDINYYKEAIDIIQNKVNDKVKVFLFSDDLNWVKENIIPSIENIYDYKIADINDNVRGYFDFYLISKCKYQISSSGSFCKVAYQFNSFKNKILITPYNIKDLL